MDKLKELLDKYKEIKEKAEFLSGVADEEEEQEEKAYQDGRYDVAYMIVKDLKKLMD
jgi:hypothetical protein